MISGALLRGRWFWLGAWALWLVLCLPRTALASTAAAGFCDDRGATSIAPLAVKPLPDDNIGVHVPAEPAVCELGSGQSCSFDEGRPLAPEAGDSSLVDALALSVPVPPVQAVRVEVVTWAPSRRQAASPGWSRAIEHPPRPAAAGRS